MTNFLFYLVIGQWIALHSSQSLMDLMDFLLVATALWTAIKNKDLKLLATSFRPSLLWPVWILVIVGGFIFGAPVEAETAIKSVWEFRWVISFLSYVYLFRQVDWNERLFKVLSGALLVISILGIIMFFVNYHLDPRAGGLFGHSMPFAHSMGPAALFLLFIGFKKALESNRGFWERALYALAPTLATLLVVLSFTRGIWIGFVAALLVGAAVIGRKVLMATLGILVIAGGVMFATSSRIQTRVMGKTIAETQSNNERLLFWKANLAIFKDYPAFGIGYSQNNIHVEAYLKKQGVDWLGGAHAHNQYIHFLAGTGALGLAAFLVFLGGVFSKIGFRVLALRFIQRNQKTKSAQDEYYFLVGIFAALLCFAIGALTESNFSIAKNRFMFLFIAAIGYALSLQKTSGKGSKE